MKKEQKENNVEALPKKQSREFERIKKEQELAQQRLREETQLEEQKELEKRARDDEARAKAKAIIEELRIKNEIKAIEGEKESTNTNQKSRIENTVLKAQKIVDEIKEKKEREQSQEKAKELAFKLKDKEKINPSNEGNYYKNKELVSQDDARAKAKLIVEEIRAENKKRLKRDSEEDITQKAQSIVAAIKQNKIDKKMPEVNDIEKSSDVVLKAKALVDDIKAQTNITKEESIEKAKELISDIKAKKDSKKSSVNENKALEREFKNSQTQKYTIAISNLATNSNSKLIKKRYGLTEDIVIYALFNNGKKNYQVLYGVFETQGDAIRVIESLHPKVQDKEPIVDRIYRHQKLYEQYNVKSGE